MHICNVPDKTLGFHSPFEFTACCLYLTSKSTATSIYYTSDGHIVEFSISSFIQLPTSRTSCIVVGLDLVTDFGVLNGAVLDETVPDECLPVLDHKR